MIQYGGMDYSSRVRYLNTFEFQIIVGYTDLILHCRDIQAKVWTHMVFVWNRSTRVGKLYLDGASAGEKAYTGQDIDLNLTNHTTYELGFKKDTKEILHGSLRDLMVFLRPLTFGEAFILYSKLCIFYSMQLQAHCERFEPRSLLISSIG